MKTITLPKTEYEMLRKKASLYEQVFQSASRQNLGLEEYSDKRIQGFMKEDRLDRKTREKVEKLLRSS